jgi:anti-sigma-K factor RskA
MLDVSLGDPDGSGYPEPRMVTSSSPHNSEAEEQAALYALELLEGAERVGFETHLAGCERCQALVDQDRLTTARLSAAAPEMEPSAGLKERLLRRAAGELARREEVPAPAPVPKRPRLIVLRGGLARALLPLAAVLVLALGVGGLIGQQWYGNQVLASATLQGTGVPGAAMVLVRRSGEAEVDLRGLPAPPSGHVYEVWAIPSGGQPIPAGTHAAGDGTVSLTVPVIGRTVAITVEPAPGSEAPTTQPLLVGAVTA